MKKKYICMVLAASLVVGSATFAFATTNTETKAAVTTGTSVTATGAAVSNTQEQ